MSQNNGFPVVPQVLARHALLYSAGADAATDRPAHVRAGSACCFVDVPGRGQRLAVVQDDANFIALVDVARPRDVDVIPLPAGAGGLRQFDALRGNKKHKLDLESMVALTLDGVPALVAFGSGSLAGRDVVVVVRFYEARTDVQMVALPALYAALQARRDFAGDELNIEGAVLVDDTLCLVNRGNGAGIAVDAVIELPLGAFLAHLAAPSSTPPPSPGRCRVHAPGAINGVRLTLTDATRLASGRLLVLAAAEASPNAVDDGEVVGTALGVLDGDAPPVFSPLLDERGEPLCDKVEGVALDPERPDVAWVVVDKDDPSAPAELLRVQLSGAFQ